MLAPGPAGVTETGVTAVEGVLNKRWAGGGGQSLLRAMATVPPKERNVDLLGSLSLFNLRILLALVFSQVFDLELSLSLFPFLIVSLTLILSHPLSHTIDEFNFQGTSHESAPRSENTQQQGPVCGALQGQK